MNCLYNGVELLALPEWDKTIYPHACIAYGSGLDGAYLTCSTEPIGVDSDGLARIPTTGERIDFVYYDWLPVKSWKTHTASGTLVVGPVIWTNTDILNSDGTLYLAASDPIPVGSAPEVEPKSFMNGWLCG